MELVIVLKELMAHKRALLVGIVVAFAAAVLSVCRISLFPPGVHSRGISHSAASTQVYVDGRESLVGNLGVGTSESTTLATVYANLMSSAGAMQLIGQAAGIPGDQIWAAGPVDPSEQRVQVEPTVTKRDVEIVGDSDNYRIEFLTDPALPVVDIYTQAPTTTEAVALANASVKVLRTYIRQAEVSGKTPKNEQVVIRSTGPALGGVVDPGIAKKLALMTFVIVYLGWLVLILIGTRVASAWRQAVAVRELDDTLRQS